MKVLRKGWNSRKFTKNSYRIICFKQEQISYNKNINIKLIQIDNKINNDKTLFSMISRKFFFKKFNASPFFSENYKFKHEEKKMNITVQKKI